MCMVLYHSLNYLRYNRGGGLLLYLRFLPPSFIFISGFLITHIYLAKYRADDPRLHQRLFTRGAKLLAVFTVLNILVNFFVSRNFNGMRFGFSGFISHLPEIYFTGAGRKGIFLVLAPIAYLLMFSGMLLRLQSWRFWLPVLFLAAAIGDFLLDYWDYDAPNLGFIAFGLMGMSFGLSQPRQIDGLARHWIILSALCAGYVAFLTWWGDDTWLEYIGVVVMIAFIYSLGRLCTDKSLPSQILILLGSYSLLSYIVQILILQISIRIFRFAHWHQKVALTGFILASVGMTGFIKLADWSRKKHPMIDHAYRAIFA